MPPRVCAYRVKPDHLADHLTLLHRVRAELADGAEAVTWLSHRHADAPTRFADLVVTDRPGRFSALESWAAFRSGLDERCDEPPVMTELTPVAADGRPARV